MKSLATLVELIFQLYAFLFLARALLGWTGISPYHPVAQVLWRLTEPVLAPIRRLMPPTGMLDFSPMVAMILVYVVGELIRAILLS
jgi:YggT family protein